MAYSVEMPELGESVTEGTITHWLKEVGDTVEADEPLLEVSTDKVDTEIPSPAAGVLLEIKAEEDDTIDVGTVIAIIGEEGEDSGSASSEDKDDAPAEDEAPAEDAKETETEAKPKAEPKKGSGGTATDVQMPELGESVTEGTITQWLKQVGDEVEVDEPLLEVSTDKVDTEIPSPVAGTIVEILADEDDTIDVGAVIARIGDADAASEEATEATEPAESEEERDVPSEEAIEEAESKDENATVDEAKKDPKAEEAEEPKKSPAAEKSEEPKKSSATEKIDNNGNVPYVTPLVRKLADKHGVDLNSIEGTGVGGRIRKQDVLAAAEGGSAEGSAEQASGKSTDARANWSTKSVDPEKAELIGTTQKVNRIRQITAEKMVESLQTSAQLTHVQEVDMSKVWDLRKSNKQAFVDKHGANPTFLGFIVKAAAEALVSHPNVNASYNAETKEMTYHADVNIGIAVDTPQGLLVPVVKKAQDKSLVEIVKDIADLADRARNRKLRPDDLTGGTFTVSNIGSEGALLDTPVLTPPQAGILGTAAIQKRPVVVTEDGADAIAIRYMCYLPFTYDHQVVDGADAGRFITTIKDRLETADFAADLEV